MGDWLDVFFPTLANLCISASSLPATAVRRFPFTQLRSSSRLCIGDVTVFQVSGFGRVLIAVIVEFISFHSAAL